MADTLGGRIAEYRKIKGVTQDELAERLGVTPQAVSKWENDLTCPDISALPQLADYFNVTIDELLRGKSMEARLPSEAERKPMSEKLLRILITSSGGDTVKVNLPLGLIKAALDIGMQLPQVSGMDALKDIDFNAIMMMADSGVIGNIVEIKSADGDDIRIVIE